MYFYLSSRTNVHCTSAAASVSTHLVLLETRHQSLATQSGSGVDSGLGSDGPSRLNMSELWETLKLIVIVRMFL